jgi:hypothetical protein
MELIRGRTLEAHLREHGRLGAREAALIGTDLCRALAAVHGAGLVHGDVKTLNVMREEGGRTVLMDFGTGLEVPLESSPSNRGLCGTPLYLAPEIHRGEEATPRSDLFSLGVLLFHLVTGGYPFVARTLSELTEAHRRGKWRHLRDARADLPDAFVQVVERALAPDPADRFGSAGEMELALSTALREVERRDVVPGPSPINPIPAPEPTRRTLTPTRVVVAAASLAAAAMALFLIPRWLDGRDEIPVDTGRPPVFKEQASPSGTDVSGPGTVTQPLQQPEPFGAPPSPANAVTGGVKEPELPVAIPLAIEATLFQRGEIADRPLSNGDKVRTDDQLYLEITTTEPAHLYVLEQDEEGRAYVLFPLPGGDLRNPISPGAKQRLPGKLEGAAVNWKVSSAGGREAFLVVASRRRLAELEDLLSGIEPASFGLPVDATSTMVAALRRGIGGLEKEPSPSQAGPPFGMLREALTRLAAGQRSTEQIWLREIILQNPGK